MRRVLSIQPNLASKSSLHMCGPGLKDVDIGLSFITNGISTGLASISPGILLSIPIQVPHYPHSGVYRIAFSPVRIVGQHVPLAASCVLYLVEVQEASRTACRCCVHVSCGSEAVHKIYDLSGKAPSQMGHVVIISVTANVQFSQLWPGSTDRYLGT